MTPSSQGIRSPAIPGRFNYLVLKTIEKYLEKEEE